MLFAVDEFFTEAGFAQPATYTNPSDEESDILVVFDREYTESSFEGVAVSDRHPAATCRTQDVNDATVEATLLVHDTLLDEDGNELVDESGNLLIGDGAAGSYKVLTNEPDGTGVSVLRLSSIQGN